MLKLNASYSKKVPAKSEYFRHSYHMAIELELPNNLTINETQDQIADIFKLCRESVKNELNPQDEINQIHSTTPTKKLDDNELTVSFKQVFYIKLLSLDIAMHIKKHSGNNVYYLIYF